MQSRCEFLEGCKMFSYFCRAAEDVYRYCYCEGNFENCARRKMRMSGQPVPASLLPQGGKLLDESAGEEPPIFYLS